MTASDVLAFAERLGVTVRLLESGKIRLGGDPADVAEVQPAVTQHRAEIVELLRQEPQTDAAGFSLEIPPHVREMLSDGQYGVDQFPNWQPETCAEFLRDREKEFSGQFKVRGYLGLQQPDDWPPHIRIAFQSVYVRSLQGEKT